jgi:hypothetical protein
VGVEGKRRFLEIADEELRDRPRIPIEGRAHPIFHAYSEFCPGSHMEQLILRVDRIEVRATLIQIRRPLGYLSGCAL